MLVQYGTENAGYTIKESSEFIVDFHMERIEIEDKEHKKISIVGGYISTQVASRPKYASNHRV
ncbi:MAG: hypothetical protein WAM14_09915 [Candidatus Nitrosopolaris sp.]